MKNVLIFSTIFWSHLFASQAVNTTKQMPENIEAMVTNRNSHLDSEGLETLKSFLLQDSGNINARTKEGMTLAMIYSRKRNYEAEKLIAPFKPDLSLKDNKGWNALHHATYSGDYVVFKRLIVEYGLNFNEQTEDGKTSLDLANEALKTHTSMSAGSRDPKSKVLFLKGKKALSGADLKQLKDKDDPKANAKK